VSIDFWPQYLGCDISPLWADTLKIFWEQITATTVLILIAAAAVGISIVIWLTVVIFDMVHLVSVMSERLFRPFNLASYDSRLHRFADYSAG